MSDEALAKLRGEVYSQPLRRRILPRAAPALQAQGKARRTAHEAIRPEQRRALSGTGRARSDEGPVPALQADLEPVHRLADGKCRLRCDRDRSDLRRIRFSGRHTEPVAFAGFTADLRRGKGRRAGGNRLSAARSFRGRGFACCLSTDPQQHFTQPPARYTEATLVRAMEEKGVGRPSTYATIVSTIQDREYVQKIEKRLSPTPLGEVVNGSDDGAFPEYHQR